MTLNLLRLAERAVVALEALAAAQRPVTVVGRLERLAAELRCQGDAMAAASAHQLATRRHDEARALERAALIVKAMDEARAAGAGVLLRDEC